MYLQKSQLNLSSRNSDANELRAYPDSKNLGQWMGPIWQAQLGESLVMLLIGPSRAPKFIALLGTKFGTH